MNEVNGYPASNTLARAASSKGTVDADVKPVLSGNGLPPTQENSQAGKEVVEASKEALTEAVSQMNQFIQQEQRDLHFSLDEASGHMVVKVMDRSSGDLIRQIPNEIFLDLARDAREIEEIRLISVHG